MHRPSRYVAGQEETEEKRAATNIPLQFSLHDLEQRKTDLQLLNRVSGLLHVAQTLDETGDRRFELSSRWGRGRARWILHQRSRVIRIPIARQTRTAVP